jgi:4-amino-4-deoxy-L-arabinose transferase-like glycosyltransferase
MSIWSNCSLTRGQRLLLGILSVAFLVRLLVVLVVYHDYQIANDAFHWHSMAVNFLNGRGLVVAKELVPYRTPLPALYQAGVYALFGISTQAAQIANAIIGTFTVLLVYDLTRRALGPGPARWSALLTALYPMILLYTGQLISETLFLLLVSLALWLAWTSIGGSFWRWGLLGLVLGLAVLTRQTAAVIGLMVSGWVFFYCGEKMLIRRLAAAGFVLLLMALTVSTWVARNYLVSGRLILTAQGGDSLWLANNPYSDGTEGETSGQPVYIIPAFEAMPEIERSAAYQNKAISWIRENPGRFLSLIPRRMIWLWHLTYHAQNSILSEVAFLVVYYPVLLLAIIGSIKTWELYRPWLLLLLTVPVALTLVHAVYLPVGRYRLPVELVLCILAGTGFFSILKKESGSEKL